MRPRGFILLALIVFSLAASVRAEVQLGVTIGWQGPYRAGRWTPVYVTASDNKPRQVILELYVPTDQSYAMKIVQKFAIGPTPATFPLYVPLPYSLESASITLLDENTLKRLGTIELNNYSPIAVRPDHMLIGISGNEGTQRLLQGQLKQSNINTGFLPQSFMPRVPVGFEGLDLLVLDAPNFNRLDADQQHAIVQWVRGGGNLLVIPGTDPLPEGGPLLEVLPVKFGATRTFDLPAAAREAAGLAERFATLKGRTVAAVADGATTKKIFGESEIAGYRQWLGFGQVMVIPADVSMLIFNKPGNARAFWTNALEEMVKVPKEDDASGNYYGNWQDDPRQHRATLQALNWIADVPGAGEFGFSYLAMALLAMMLVVGPVDWFILKWLGRQPWTWVTTTGWIGVVTLAAIYTGHIFKSGDLHFRSVTLMDEADGMRVAQTSVAGIYAPKTREYELKFPAESWWKPASHSVMSGQPGLQREIDCHQDYRGNRPLPMLINVWNLRFLQGTEATPTGAAIAAKLSRNGDELSGSITNHGEFPITDIAIRTRDGPLRLKGRLEPGATMPVSGRIDRKDNSLATVPLDARSRHNYAGELPSTRPSLPTGGELSAGRSDRIEQLLREQPDLACVYAQFDDAKAQAVTLDEPEAREAHVGLIRALVAVK